MTLNPNKHHRRSLRLKDYDYSQEGLYFVTICTKDRECLFGKIENEKMILSPVGVIADILWREIKSHFPNVDLGEFIVMPNHVHGIIIIDEKTAKNAEISNTNHDVGATHALPNKIHALPDTNNILPDQNNKNNTERVTRALPLHTNMRFQNQGKRTLSAIVGSYKSTVSKHAHRLGFYFEWQRNFHDHIIRNEKSYNTISEYIMTNPMKWTDDKFYVR